MAKQSDLAELQLQLRELPGESAPAALEQRLLATLEQADATPRVSYLHPRRRWFAQPSWQAGMALAACSAMLFLWFFWVGDSASTNGSEPTTRAVPQLVANDELSRLQAASADLEQVLQHDGEAPIYGDDQAWAEHTLQLALYQVDADLAAQPAQEQQVHLWTQRVALLAGMAEQSRGSPLGSGVEWVQVN